MLGGTLATHGNQRRTICPLALLGLQSFMPSRSASWCISGRRSWSWPDLILPHYRDRPLGAPRPTAIDLLLCLLAWLASTEYGGTPSKPRCHANSWH